MRLIWCKWCPMSLESVRPLNLYFKKLEQVTVIWQLHLTRTYIIAIVYTTLEPVSFNTSYTYTSPQLTQTIGEQQSINTIYQCYHFGAVRSMSWTTENFSHVQGLSFFWNSIIWVLQTSFRLNWIRIEWSSTVMWLSESKIILKCSFNLHKTLKLETASSLKDLCANNVD